MCERKRAQSDLFPFFSLLLLAFNCSGKGLVPVLVFRRSLLSKLMDFLAVFRFFNVSFVFCAIFVLRVEIVLSLRFVHARLLFLGNFYSDFVKTESTLKSIFNGLTFTHFYSKMSKNHSKLSDFEAIAN